MTDTVLVNVEEIREYDANEEFASFVEKHGIKLVARQRWHGAGGASGEPWLVTSEGMLEIVGNGILTSTHGNGSTPHEALEDYASQLSGQLLLIGGRNGVRVQAPTWKEDW